MIRKHPGISAGLLAFSPQAVKMVYGKGQKTMGLAKKASDVTKIASDSPEYSMGRNIRNMALFSTIFPGNLVGNVAALTVDTIAFDKLVKATDNM